MIQLYRNSSAKFVFVAADGEVTHIYNSSHVITVDTSVTEPTVTIKEINSENTYLLYQERIYRVRDEAGVRYTLNTFNTFLNTFVDAISGGVLESLTLTPSMQVVDGDYFPITITHTDNPTKVIVTLEDENGNVQEGITIQNIYQTILGVERCVSTKIWFASENTSNYIAEINKYFN
jgi:hypothetical protein